MKQDAIEWQKVFYAGSERTAWRPNIKPERYDLTTALLVVRRMETSAGRGAVFEEIKNKNLLYRLVDSFYSNARFVQPLLLFAYMLKSVLSVGPFDDEKAEAVAISNFDNEHQTVSRVAGIVPDVRLLRLSIKRRHIFQRGQLMAGLRMLGCLGRLWSFLRILSRSHSFMPSARMASALAFYMRFVQLFADRPALHAALVASNYSPEAVGMAAAAHLAGKRVIYANHAPVPANGAVVPPVLADCALFYGDAARKTYEHRSRCRAEVALIGQPGPFRDMSWRADVKKIGIFLTSGTRIDKLEELVSAIRATDPDVEILIRNHPVALLKNDFSDLASADGKIEITIGNPLDDEITACDLIICGNSGVALNVLRGGRPVAYIASLDHVRYDSNGFVQSGLVCPMPAWRDDIYTCLKRFYCEPSWQHVMRSYDASYGSDIGSIEQAAADTLRRYFRLEPGQDVSFALP